MEKEEAERQREQLGRYLAWVREEGGVEGPGHLDTWFKPNQLKRLSWLKRHCQGTIMELGCNYGYPLAFCGGQIGVDWNEKSIALAQILNPSKRFVVADIRELPFPDSFIDTVMVCDVLEHIPWGDVFQALKEARRVARRKVLVTMPDGEKNTPEATCFKHRWLCLEDNVQSIAKEFSNEKVTIERKGEFILIEVSKDGA